jgi:RNA polymerase sigma factor (sigma-70 family)
MKSALSNRFQQTPEQEATLVRRLIARDADVMATIYDCYAGLVYSTILRVVRDHETAEDLTQETFLRVWNRIGAFDRSRGNLLSWIAAIARNQAIDYVRSSAAVKLVHPPEDLVQPMVDHRADFEEGILLRDWMRSFKGTLECLPEHKRAILNLCFVNGMTHAEVARAVDRPLGTVKTWIRTTLQALRAQMEIQNPAPLVNKGKDETGEPGAVNSTS